MKILNATVKKLNTVKKQKMFGVAQKYLLYLRQTILKNRRTKPNAADNQNNKQDRIYPHRQDNSSFRRNLYEFF
jgi:hypothetical protein